MFAAHNDTLAVNLFYLFIAFCLTGHKESNIQLSHYFYWLIHRTICPGAADIFGFSGNIPLGIRESYGKAII
jgi:hypothetical protein